MTCEQREALTLAVMDELYDGSPETMGEAMSLVFSRPFQLGYWKTQEERDEQAIRHSAQVYMQSTKDGYRFYKDEQQRLRKAGLL